MTDLPPYDAPLPPIHRPPEADAPEDVIRYLRRLPRGGPTRRLAEALLGRAALPLDCIGPVAGSLTEPAKNGWRENLVAVWAAARCAGPSDRSAAAGWLSHVLEFWPSRDSGPRMRRSYIRTMIALYVIMTAGSLARGGTSPAIFFTPPFSAIPLCVLAYPLSAWLDRSRLNRIRAEAAKGLGLLRVPSSASPLALAALDSYENVRTAGRNALIEVLPTLTEEQYGRLPMDMTPRLCALLTRSDEFLVLLTIQALRAVGDSRAILPMERFAKAAHRRWKDQGIAVEADMTLSVLYARQKRENEAASLLRPTQNPHDPQQELLRPYLHSGDQPTENLLRAAVDE